MKVLVVGGGGREHAICWKLAQSPKVTELYCAPGNAGIAQVATCVPVKATDVEGMVAWAKENAMDFVMVAPDDPLALGMVDAMEAAGIPAFGPHANAAIIEASKAFSKSLMKKYNIPTAKYETFTEMDKALAYIEEQGAPIVVKADGLALGKGVVVAQTVEEAQKAVREMMEDHKFGASGSTVVIEECMVGPEVTVLAFCDGEHLSCMPSSQDHKRAYDDNQGPNTGGMGAFSPSPNYTPEIAKECMEKIFLPTVAALKAEGRPFKGVIYFGLMLTKDGPRVVEYNARFGDPETQAVLSLLDSDLMDIFEACVNGTLDKVDIQWKSGAACCLVLASGGYPVKYQSGYPISGLEDAGKSAVVFHAGTKKADNGDIVTAGGRVLGVTAVGIDLPSAIAKAYAAAKPITFQDMHFRTDIGGSMNLLRLEGVVFDMDGVIIDSERIGLENWTAVGNEMGWPQVGEHYLEFVGRTWFDIQKRMLELWGPEFPMDEFFQACRQRTADRAAAEGLPLKPGVREILDFFKARHIPIALATSTHENRTIKRLEVTGLTSYFQSITCGNQVTHGKPDPEIYQLACQRLGTDPARTIAIEDSRNGILSAASAGMQVIMVPDLIPPTPDLEERLFKRFDSLLDLRDYLSEIL